MASPAPGLSSAAAGAAATAARSMDASTQPSGAVQPAVASWGAPAGSDRPRKIRTPAQADRGSGGGGTRPPLLAKQPAPAEPDEEREQSHAARRGGLHEGQRREVQRDDVERPSAEAGDEAGEPLPVREEGGQRRERVTQRQGGQCA